MSEKTGCVGVIVTALVGGIVVLFLFAAFGTMEKAAAPFFPTPTAIVVQAPPAQNDTHAIDAVVDVSKHALDKQAQVAMAGDAGMVAIASANAGADAVGSLALLAVAVVFILILVKSFNGGGGGQQ